MLEPSPPHAEQGHSCCGTSSTSSANRFLLLLINPYELGRQSFALAEASAWLKRAGLEVHCLDLALQKLEPAVLAFNISGEPYIKQVATSHFERQKLIIRMDMHRFTRLTNGFARGSKIRSLVVRIILRLV